MSRPTERAEKSVHTTKAPAGTEKANQETSQAGRDNDSGSFPITFKKGDAVKDRYVITDSFKPGTGGESYLYLCEDRKSGKRMVLKLYHAGYEPQKEILEKLLSVSHPNLVAIRHYGREGKQFYEIMDYAEGGSLYDHAHMNSFPESELTGHVIPAVNDALGYLHSQDIIHRDIKPDNLFYKDPGRNSIIVGDFGIATRLEKGVSQRFTKRGLTLDYAAPEMMVSKDGKHLAGKEVDYYALGMTLIHLYLGHSPMDGLNDVQKMAKHVSERIPLPETLSPRFKKLLTGLLKKDRKDRWERDKVERWLSGEDIEVEEDVLDYQLPYKLTDDVVAHSCEELAVLLQNCPDITMLKERLARKSISRWLDSFDPPKADKVSEIEERTKDTGMAVLEISCLLDKYVPYFFTLDLSARTPRDAARILDQNRHLKESHYDSGRLKIWLKYTPGGQEILDLWESYQERRIGH